jgi:hypothetical protein
VQNQPNNNMNTKSVFERGLLAGLMTLVSCLLPTAQAGTEPAVEPISSAPSPTWKWGISADYMYRDVDREEDYLSFPFDWHVEYKDFDGDLWGFSAFLTPPMLCGATFDFSYRTGDLDGRFENYSIDPRQTFGRGPFEGDADFDRDEYVIGLTVPCQALNWLYARLEWFQFDEDGDWNYDGGGVEEQEYTLWGISAGVGAAQEYPLGSSGATLGLNAFLGLVYFDFEHDEVGFETTDWDDWGFMGRVGARVSYPIQQSLDVFLGCGYEYIQTDSGDMDMTNQGVFVNLGLKGEF